MEGEPEGLCKSRVAETPDCISGLRGRCRAHCEEEAIEWRSRAHDDCIG